MHSGLRSLPFPEVSMPPAGRWCCETPIWGNPLLQPATGGRSLAEDFPAVAAWLPNCRIRDLTYHHFQLHSLPALANPFLTPLRLQIHHLLGSIPADWREAAWEHAGAGGPPLDEWQALHPALGSLRWQLGGHTFSLPHLTVRRGTRLQLLRQGAPALAHRRQKLAAFVALADHPNPQPAAPLGAQATPEVQSEAAADEALRLLARLWKVKWNNAHKEVFWRLALDGLPVAARMKGGAGRQQPRCCACGHSKPDRRHHFWECPVAKAVVETVAAQLGPNKELTPRNLWLGSSPGGVHTGVWDVVCLAAIAAMDSGRRRMTKTILNARQRNAQPAPDLVHSASQQAVARFWDLLQDFCSISTAPLQWQEQVGEGHPFFSWHAASMQWVLSYPFT